jgi:hypothetical protein
MFWHTIFCIWVICAAVPFTCSLLCIIQLQGSHHHKINQTRMNFELESATSPPLIGPLSRMRYHWIPLVFYFYVGRASHQFSGLWRLLKLRPWCLMTAQSNKTNFELESATSPPPIGPLSRMRYHWKPLIFYYYMVRASYQLNGLWRFSRSRQWGHDNTTKQERILNLKVPHLHH